MTPADRDMGYIWDMHDAARQALEFSVGKSLDDYNRDKMLRLSTERLIEIIGQAVREVSHDFRERYPHVPWVKIIGLRNLLAHEYGEVKDEKIYLVVIKDIPVLIDQLKQILIENNELHG